jgi:hypothetical protein
MFGAMRTTVDFAAFLDSMAEDPAITMCTARRHRLDRTFETIECHRASILADSESLVVLVATNVAFSHCFFLRQIIFELLHLTFE